MKSTKKKLKKILIKIQKEKNKQNTMDYYCNPQCNGCWVNNGCIL